MTDGRLYFSENGEEMKAFNILDGQGIKMLMQSGVLVAVITGRTSRLVARRMENLGISFLYQGREDKFDALQELLAAEKLDIRLDEIAHVGDDYPDLTVMQRVGMGIAVANAHPVVKRLADGITTLRGGEGAVREVCDMIVSARGAFDRLTAPWTNGYGDCR
jgi:3-deoxy-D-manno-octulosonate 8-phosphate phosphatase (KDO 8-P phosphatase)